MLLLTQGRDRVFNAAMRKKEKRKSDDVTPHRPRAHKLLLLVFVISSVFFDTISACWKLSSLQRLNARFLTEKCVDAVCGQLCAAV